MIQFEVIKVYHIDVLIEGVFLLIPVINQSPCVTGAK